MDQKGPIMTRKGLKLYENTTKNEVFGPKIPAFLAEFSLAELGDTPPLNGQNPLKRF